MKYLITLITVSAFLLSGISLQAEMRIGVVDMDLIFQSYYKTKEAQKKVNDRQAEIKKDIDERRAKLKELLDKWQELDKIVRDAAVNEDVREKTRKEQADIAAEAKSLEREVQEFTMRKKRQLGESMNRMRKGILEEITLLVSESAKKEGYDLVFDKSGKSFNGIPVLLHSKDAKDFSQEIVDELNKDAEVSEAETKK